MIDVLFLFGVLCASYSAWRGNRTAIALLSSAALSSLLIWCGVPFNMAFWLMIDIAVVGVIALRPVAVSEILILALFIPIWIFYAVEDSLAPDVVNTFVALQLLISAPWRWAFRTFIPRFEARLEEGDLLKEAHA